MSYYTFDQQNPIMANGAFGATAQGSLATNVSGNLYDTTYQTECSRCIKRCTDTVCRPRVLDPRIPIPTIPVPYPLDTSASLYGTSASSAYIPAYQTQSQVGVDNGATFDLTRQMTSMGVGVSSTSPLNGQMNGQLTPQQYATQFGIQYGGNQQLPY